MYYTVVSIELCDILRMDVGAGVGGCCKGPGKENRLSVRDHTWKTYFVFRIQLPTTEPPSPSKDKELRILDLVGHYSL